MRESVLKLKYDLSISGMESYGKYYATYIGVVEEYYPKYDRVDVKVNSLRKDLNYLAFVPIKKNPHINIPFKKGDNILITFLNGIFSMPIAEYAYHSFDKEKVKTSKSDKLNSPDFYQFLTPNGLMIEEIEKGFQITKGKLLLKFTEDEIIIKTSRGKIVVDGDFTVNMGTGTVKLNSNTGNTMINMNSLVSFINKLSLMIQGHTHVVSTSTPPIATPSPIIFPTLLSTLISVKNVKGG